MNHSQPQEIIIPADNSPVSRLQKLKSSIQSQSQQLTPLTPMTPDIQNFAPYLSSTPKPNRKSSKWSLLKKQSTTIASNQPNSYHTIHPSSRKVSSGSINTTTSSASLSRSSRSSFISPTLAPITISSPFQSSPLSPTDAYTSRTSQTVSPTRYSAHTSFLGKTSKKYAQYLKNNQQQSTFQLQRPPKGFSPPTPPLERPIYDADSESIGSRNTPSTTSSIPPPVTPYTLKTRRDKSLEDKLCCVCEERIEYTFDGEHIVVLECNDVCHIACLKALYVETMYTGHDEIQTLKAALETGTDISQLQQNGLIVPLCPTCDEPAIPTNRSILDSFNSLSESDLNENLITVNLNDTSLMDAESLENINFYSSSSLNSNYDQNYYDHESSPTTAAEDPTANYMDDYMPYDNLTSKALASPVANFTDCFRLYKQSATVQSAISPWDFEPEALDSIDSELYSISQQSDPKNVRNKTSSISLRRKPSKIKVLSSIKDPQTGSISSVSAIATQGPTFKSPTSGKTQKYQSTFSNSFSDFMGTSSTAAPLLSAVTVNAVELSKGIPDSILKTRLKKYKPPSIDLVTETKSVHITQGDTKDLYVTSQISVQTPLPIQSSDDPYLNQPKEIDSKVRADLTNHVKNSIQDWKERQLEVSQFGTLRLHDRFYVSMNGQKWQFLDCYLFDNILIFVRTFPNNLCAPTKPPVLKGSVDIRNHLMSITLPPSSYPPSYYSTDKPQHLDHFMTLHLSTDQLPTLHFKTNEPIAIENWYVALMNWSHKFPLTRLVSSDDYTGQSLASQMYYEEVAPDSFYSPTSSHIPTDTVVLIPMFGSPQGSKFPAIKDALKTMLSKMNLFDRIAVVPYGHYLNTNIPAASSFSVSAKHNKFYGLASSDWQNWGAVFDSLKATGARGSRADLIDGLNQAFYILQKRNSLNPVVSIYVISDSAGNDCTNSSTGPSDSSVSKADIESVAGRAALDNITIHSIGVTMNHLADDLDVLSTKTCGSYHYLRDWNDLTSVTAGVFDTTQRMGYSDVSLSIGTTSLFEDEYDAGPDNEPFYEADDIIISEVSGHNHIRIPTFQSMPLPSPLLPSPTSTEALSSQECVQEHLVELGDMAVNHKRTFLVQVRVRLEAIIAKLHLCSQQQERTIGEDAMGSVINTSRFDQQQLELFHLSLSYKSFTTNPSSLGSVFMLPVGGALIPIEYFETDIAFPIADEFVKSVDSTVTSPSSNGLTPSKIDRGGLISPTSPYNKYSLCGSVKSHSSYSSSIISYYHNNGFSLSSPNLSEAANALDLALPKSFSPSSVPLPSSELSLNSLPLKSPSELQKKNSWIMRRSIDGTNRHPDYPGKPSILFGDLVPRPRKDSQTSKPNSPNTKYNRQSVSTYLALELYDVHVVLRRIELTAVNLFQYIVRFDFNKNIDDKDDSFVTEPFDQTTRQHNTNLAVKKVYGHVAEARALIQGLFSCAVATKRDPATHSDRTIRILSDEWQSESKQYSAKNCASSKLAADPEYIQTCKTVAHTTALALAIDKVLDTVCDHLDTSNLNALQQNYRKVLLQYIGILKNQRAYTNRSEIEELYFV